LTLDDLQSTVGLTLATTGLLFCLYSIFCRKYWCSAAFRDSQHRSKICTVSGHLWNLHFHIFREILAFSYLWLLTD